MNKIHLLVVFIVLFIGAALVFPSRTEAALNSSFGLGTSGPQVQELQQALTNLNYYSGPITGYFGSLTQAAVIQFQKANRIFPQSGYFGPLTLAKLNTSGIESSGAPLPLGQYQGSPPASPYTLILDGKKYTVTLLQNGGFRVRGFLDSSGVPVRDINLAKQLAGAAWAYEDIVKNPSVARSSERVRGYVEVNKRVRSYELAQDVLARANVEVLAIVLSGGSAAGYTISNAAKNMTKEVVKSQLADPFAYLALTARLGLEEAESKYLQMEPLVDGVKSSGQIDVVKAAQIRTLYFEAHPLDLKFGALLSLLNPQSWTDLVMKAINSAKDEVLGSVIPAWDELDIARSVLSLTEKLDAILEKTQAPGYQIYLGASKIAASEKMSSDNQVSTWANAAISVDANSLPIVAVPTPTPIPPTPIPPTPTTNTMSASQAQLNALLQQVALLQNQLRGQQNNPTITPTPTPSSPTPISSPPPASATSPYNVPPPSGSSGGGGGSVGSNGGGGGGTISPPITGKLQLSIRPMLDTTIRSALPPVVVDPFLLITPTPGYTPLVLEGIWFTQGGDITETITQPDGITYTLHHKASYDDRGHYAEYVDTATASFFGTYMISFTDDTTGKKSNTASLTIKNNSDMTVIVYDYPELLPSTSFNVTIHQIRKDNGKDAPATYSYSPGGGYPLLKDIEFCLAEAKHNGWKYDIVPK